MRILYISRLSGQDWQGPTHSVPMQIKHQSFIDEVLWVNLCHSERADWKELPYYLESKNGTKIGLSDLSQLFGTPDMVVFEGVYEYPFAKIIFDVWKQRISYVIVPRSALTMDAQKKKAFKKKVGNFFFFKKFIQRATAVHYLTVAEQKDSEKWHTPYFIIPNGTHPVATIKQFSEGREGLIWSYIGRIEKYQKGLDLLLLACADIVDELKSANVQIHLYGPDREDSCADLKNDVKKYGLESVIFFHEGVFGDQKKNVLLSSDAFIMTSRFEGLPMGMIEALAHGLPILATHGTNLADEIKEFDAGWVSDNTVDGIVIMLKTAILDKDDYFEKSRHAVELSRRFNWKEIAQTTHIEYERLVTHYK